MLQDMRKFSKSWVANIFLGLLTLSFVSWGAGSWMEAGTDNSVAKVGGKAIDRGEFSRDFQNAMRRAGEQQGQTLTAEEARKLGISDQVLEQAISTKALDNVVNKLGLTVSDAQVTATIQRIPNFAGLTGQFDRQMFQRAIERFGYTEQGFIEMIRSDMARAQLSRAIEDGFVLPPGYARFLFAYFFETRAADYFVVEDKSLGTIPTPPDATLEAYIKAHADRFSTPEYRDVTYAWIAPSDVEATIKIGDDQIKQAYEENKGTYVIPEKRDVEQLLFASETAAKAAHDKATKGTKFEDLTNETGEKPTPQAAMTEEDLGAAAKPVFALAKDGVAAPQKLPSGKWALFKVTTITPGVNRTLDQAKEEIRQQLALDAAIAKLTDISNAYTDESSKGADLLDAAKKVGMHTGHVRAIDANGLGPDGKKTEAPDDAEFRSMVFHTEAGESGDPQTTKESNIVYVVSVSGATPPKLRPLADVRERALTDWMTAERARLLKQKAQNLMAQVNKEGSLEAAAKSIGAAIQQSPAIPHGFTDDTFSAALVQAIFQAGPGKAAVGPRAKNGGYVVARITGIVHPQLPEKSPQYQIAMRQLSAQVGGSLSESYIAQQRDDQKVTYNRKVIDNVVGSEAP